MTAFALKWDETSGAWRQFLNPRRWDGANSPRMDRAVQLTTGGQAVTVADNVYFEVAVAITGIPAFGAIGGPQEGEVAAYDYIQEWASWAQQGKVFAVALDLNKTHETTLEAAVAANDSNIQVDVNGTLAIGDRIWLQNELDYTSRRITAFVGGTTWTLSRPVQRAYPIGTIVRHQDFFPKAVLLGSDRLFRERDGGRGSNQLDLAFRFRTVE